MLLQNSLDNITEKVGQLANSAIPSRTQFSKE